MDSWGVLFLWVTSSPEYSTVTLTFPLLTSSTSHSAEGHQFTLLTLHHPEDLDFTHTKNQRASLSDSKVPEALKSSRNSEPFIR